MKKNYFLFLLFLITSLSTFAQVGNAPCNDYSPWTTNNYTMSVANQTGLLGDKWNNKNNLIDANSNNATSWSAVLLGSAWIEARNSSSSTFPTGSYAGFVVGDLDLVSLGASMKVATYNNNTKQEEVTFSSFIGTILDGGKRKIGFVTTKPYNRIRLTVNAGLTLVFTANAYYAEVVKPCQGIELPCNASTPIVRTNFGAIIETSRTGLSGVTLGSINNVDNVINSNGDDFASLSLNASVFGTAKLSVRDLGDIFSAGTFAGFDIENANLTSLTAFNNITLKTYLNGVLQEQKSGSSLALTLPLLDFENRSVVGFETTKSFNEVQIELNQPVGVSLGTTKVYSSVVKKPCESTPLVCNTPTFLVEPNYPVNINTVRTGVTGLASIVSRVNEPDNVLDNNENNYATLSVPATAGTTASLSVLKSLSDFPAGSYAGFDLQNVSLFNAQFLQNVTLKTYNNGFLQESVTGDQILIGVGSDFIASDGRSIIGFVTTKSFDELQISLNNIWNTDIGNMRVYKMVVTKLCQKLIDCSSSYYLTQPDFPVVLNSQRTGANTIVCLGCSVNNPDNVIDNDSTNYSRITVATGALNSGSISVLDPTATYPKGTFAGFTVKDRYFLVQGDLLEYITVKTYLDGVLQESKTASNLVDLSLLIPIWGTGTRNIGFYTTKDFDEVQITAISVASVINILDVYGAFIDTRTSNGGSLNCAQAINAENDDYTIQAGSTSTISVLNNDTYQNVPATVGASGNVVLTQTSGLNSGVTINQTTGLVSVAPSTPSGNYTITYTICNTIAPPSCDFATVTIEVQSDTVDAQDDVLTIPQGTSSTQNVLTNDTVNGLQAVLGSILITQVATDNPGVTLNTSTGIVNVAAGTAPGTYEIVYQAQTLLGNNSDTATITVIVPGNPDMQTNISVSGTNYNFDEPFDVFFEVKNVGDTTTDGSSIVVYIYKPNATDSFEYNNIPTGWTLSEQTSQYFAFTTNKQFDQGDSDLFSFTYINTTRDAEIALFKSVITNGSGGEINFLNNTALELILRQNF
jgi:hypothetical protein